MVVSRQIHCLKTYRCAAAIWLVLLAVCAAAAAAGDSSEALPATVRFDRDIRPIFSDTCFKCHGPDEKQRKAGLRLDLPDAAFANRKGKFPIVPGHSGRSEAYRRMMSTDADEHMPPPKSNKVLTQHQIELVRRWIDQGAGYEAHWSFITPRPPALPAVKNRHWPRNGIDYFILARLEEEGLRPSQQARKETLIRRVSLDLTGLPPAPSEVDAFVADSSSNAYEKVVDRLLASPRYGERMAMPWLDGARYADSHGYQGDFARSMWPWRDWVINAFNQNMPFDEFTIQQLAGDLLPNATRSQRVASGFNRNNRINAEGGIIPEEWRVEAVVDRVETTSAVWLGLTMGCCRCHDHKYDPITQKEFYRFFAYFNSVDETGTGSDGVANTPPVLKLSTPEQERRLAQLASEIKSLENRLDGPLPELDAAQADWEKNALVDPPIQWTVLDPVSLAAANGSTLTRQPDGSVLAGGKVPAKEEYTVTARADLAGITGFRLEALADSSFPGDGPGASENGNFVLTEFEVKKADGTNEPSRVKLKTASADFVQKDFDITKVIDGKADTAGWAIYPQTRKSHVAIFETKTAIAEAGQLIFILKFNSKYKAHQIGRFRLSAGTNENCAGVLGMPQSVRAALAICAGDRDDDQAKAVRDYFRADVSPPGKKLNGQLAGLRKAKSDLDGGIQSTMVMEELPKPRDTFVLIRGQYENHGDKVSPGVPRIFPPLPEGAPSNRLWLAEWIVSKSNPLTARVAVNRYWEQFFGTGIVKTTENLGSQAEWPSHPELLDWLACEFMHPTASGGRDWDIKAMQKLIVMSATYRQSSRTTRQLEERDPENRLLARGPRFRLGAEAIRDNALAIAGLLVEQTGGPSVHPYQPEGIWDEMNFYGDMHNYKHDTNGNEYRRSVYTIWKRTTPPPDMILFDMPARETCRVMRSRTDTPLQALVLMNDETYVEAARVLAERMLTGGGATPKARIAFAFRCALARSPTAAETKIILAGLDRRLSKYRHDRGDAEKLVRIGDAKVNVKLDPAELAAYAATASVILNLDETLTKE